MEPKPNAIAISFAKRALVTGSRERERMISYNQVLAQHHLIVLTREAERYPLRQEEGSLTLYATNSTTKIGMLLRAYHIAQEIIKSTPETRWVITCQDPFETSLVGWLLSFKKNTILHIQVHGDIFSSFFPRLWSLDHVRLLFAQFVLKRARSIRVVSNRIKSSLLKKGLTEHNISVLPIQANLNQFLAVGSERKFSFNDTLKLLYVGRFSREKNISMLLHACALARKSGVRLSLTLLGEGGQKEQLVNEVAKLELRGMITFMSWTNDVATVMGQHDILCLTSDHEGYAMVLLEAMAAGLPVISTDVGCAGEVVIPETHGFIVPVRDDRAFAEAVGKFYSNPSLLQKLGTQAYTASKELTLEPEEYVKKYAETLPRV
ncbi:MAG: glycosyltransferase [Patescibacteria group bacterium]